MGIKGTVIKCALVKASELELILNQATVANARAIECFLVTLHSSGGGWGRALERWMVPSSVYDKVSVCSCRNRGCSLEVIWKHFP